MRRSIALLLLAAFAVSLAGCAMHRTPVVPPAGLLFSHYKAPLTVDFDRTKVSTKRPGSATTVYIHLPYLNLSFSFDPCDIETAARNGGLKQVYYADYEMLSVLGIVGQFTVHAYGE